MPEVVSWAAWFSSGRTVPSRDFTSVDWERSAMAYCTYSLLHEEAIGTREWGKDEFYPLNSCLSFLLTEQD